MNTFKTIKNRVSEVKTNVVLGAIALSQMVSSVAATSGGSGNIESFEDLGKNKYVAKIIAVLVPGTKSIVIFAEFVGCVICAGKGIIELYLSKNSNENPNELAKHKKAAKDYGIAFCIALVGSLIFNFILSVFGITLIEL